MLGVRRFLRITEREATWLYTNSVQPVTLVKNQHDKQGHLRTPGPCGLQKTQHWTHSALAALRYGRTPSPRGIETLPHSWGKDSSTKLSSPTLSLQEGSSPTGTWDSNTSQPDPQSQWPSQSPLCARPEATCTTTQQPASP